MASRTLGIFSFPDTPCAWHLRLLYHYVLLLREALLVYWLGRFDNS